MRFTYVMDFIENDYDKYKLIENTTTEKNKIKILKNIIIKDYKLTNADFTTILENYLVTEDNLINNYKEPVYIPNELWKHIKEFMIDYKFKEKLPCYKKIYEIFTEHYYWCGYWENSYSNNELKFYFNKIFENRILHKIALRLLKINIEILQKIFDKEVSYLSTYAIFYNCSMEEQASKYAIHRNIFYIRWILIAVYKQEMKHSLSLLARRLLTWY
jgi:hypothetical protein